MVYATIAAFNKHNTNRHHRRVMGIVQSLLQTSPPPTATATTPAPSPRPDPSPSPTTAPAAPASVALAPAPAEDYRTQRHRIITEIENTIDELGRIFTNLYFQVGDFRQALHDSGLGAVAVEDTPPAYSAEPAQDESRVVLAIPTPLYSAHPRADSGVVLPLRSSFQTTSNRPPSPPPPYDGRYYKCGEEDRLLHGGF